jgi:hypothetical protein
MDKYEALSYEWGEPVFSHTIHLLALKRILYITENLHAALSRLRDASHTRHLWVDALCINQSDPDEKSQQMPLMAGI